GVGVPVAACGSAPQTRGAGASPAEAVPADALFYVDVNLDRESPAWKQFAAVGKRFPAWQHLVNRIVDGMNHGGSSTSNVSLDMGPTTTFKGDIEPWLGGSAGFAVTSLDAGSGSAHWIGFVASTDDAKAKAAILKSGNSRD